MLLSESTEPKFVTESNKCGIKFSAILFMQGAQIANAGNIF